jgi:peptidoglycan/xylan/chitin deacetylase (PgdA/CDA1 family)
MNVVHCSRCLMPYVQRAQEGRCEVTEGAADAGRKPLRTVVLTFDNLGEASELERGSWPAGQPLGRHPSVRLALPAILDELERRELTATFFVEAVNCELYPEALQEIVVRGHELGCHGWRHEDWAHLAPARERALLERAAAAFEQLGLRPRGFRPPGGDLTECTPALLAELGYRWCSPAGGGPERLGELTMLPFDWALVDAYHLMERFGELRVRRGDSARPLTPAAVEARFTRRLNASGDGGGVQTVVLHPFLMLDRDWRPAVGRLLGVIAALAREGTARVGPGGRFAVSLADGSA